MGTCVMIDLQREICKPVLKMDTWHNEVPFGIQTQSQKSACCRDLDLFRKIEGSHWKDFAPSYIEHGVKLIYYCQDQLFSKSCNIFPIYIGRSWRETGLRTTRGPATHSPARDTRSTSLSRQILLMTEQKIFCD